MSLQVTITDLSHVDSLNDLMDLNDLSSTLLVLISKQQQHQKTQTLTVFGHARP